MHLKTKGYLKVISSILSQDKFLSSDITHERKTKCCLCCDMGQNDTIGKIELNPSFVLSSDNTNCKNDIQ